MKTSPDALHHANIDRLVGVYDADGGLVGEATYIIGDLLGRLHCSLCDITHGPLRRKRAWDDMVDRLGIPFELVHRNEQDWVVRAAGVQPPAVLAVRGEVAQVLLDSQTLAALDGQVSAFERALLASIGQDRAA